MKGFAYSGLPMILGIAAASTLVIAIQKRKFESKKDNGTSLPDIESEYEV